MKQLFCFLLLTTTTLLAQDTLSFGGVYDLPGAEVRATYTPVSPLAQRFTIEEVYRLPGTFYDPARLVNLLPGVVQTNDQANHLSVRGSTPNANRWRLNGLAVVNPNHTANAGTFYDFPTLSGGGVNAISAQMLDNSAFVAGNPDGQYGFATGGTFDLQLRPGNSSRRKYQVQAGLIGFDLAAEGPLSRSGNTTLLVNGRYSFTGLLADMGVDFGGEEIRFSDFNAHLNHRGANSELSLFAVVGQSTNDFTAPDDPEAEITEQKELFNIDFTSELGIFGGNYRYDFLNGGSLSAGAALSDVAPSRGQQFSDQGPGIRNQFSRLDNQMLNAFLRYDTDRELSNSLGTFASNWFIGAEFLSEELGYRNLFANPAGGTDEDFTFTSQTTALSPYAGFSATFGEDNSQTFDYTIRGDFYLGNDLKAAYLAGSVRYAKRWGHRELSATTSLSTQPSPARLLASPNAFIEPFANQAAQFDLSFATKLLGAKVKATAFAQSTEKEYAARTLDFLISANNLYELDPNLRFDTTTSTIRYGLELEAAGGLRSEGWYYRGSLTLLDARTRQLDGSYARDRFAVGYVGKLTLGREWNGEDRKERARTYGLNLALIAHGGERYGRVTAPEITGPNDIRSFFTPQDLTDGYVNSLGTYFRPDLRLYKTKVRPKTTTTLALDIQNLASISNVGSVYYDTFLQRPNERFQLTLIPVLSYRIVWR